jgi:hypothetical protein
MGGMGMGGMGGGMGMMRIPAEKEFKVKVTTVCLEHAKKDPNPRVKYKMVPVEQFTEDPRVHEVLKQLGYNRMTQNVAQAAAWHLMDGLSWSFLANKIRKQDPVTRQTEMWFHPQELQFASLVVANAHQLHGQVDPSATRKDEYGYPAK